MKSADATFEDAMDRLAPQLAGERLAAFAEGVAARRGGRGEVTNPYIGNLLKTSLAREWSAGWKWSNEVEAR